MSHPLSQECKEEPREVCEDREMMVPSQEKEHKKKCLLPDDGSNGSTGGSTSATVGSLTPRGNKADLVYLH